ncbi:MAG: CBS domain-containing protein [Gaiellaceae bacterium]
MTIVAEIMSRSLLTVDPATALTEAARQMDERAVGAVLVFSEGRLVGILTERDVLRAVAAGQTESASVGDCMTRNPETIEPSDRAGHAASIMIHGGFRHLPVLDGGEAVGIVSIRDLMRVVIDDESPRGA